MRELIEFCESLMDDKDLELTDKSNGQLRLWICKARREMKLAVVMIPLGDYTKG